MQDLGTLGGTYSFAVSVNNQGVVVGASDLPGDTSRHAFLWDGTLHDLDTLGGTQSSPSSVNDANEVVGSASTAGDAAVHAVLWQPGMPPRDLDTFGGKSSSASKITNNHQVIGNWTATNGDQHAFVWDAQSGSVDLGSLGGGFYTLAYDINEHGQIVGEALISPQNPHAFIWANGAMTDLNDLVAPGSGWTLTFAAAINDAGEIIGQGTLNGVAHAFLLTPISSAPNVTAITPSTGPRTGSTTVTITGTGFTGATAVSFGGTPATSFTVNSDSQITAVSPPHAAGTVDVTVTSPDGMSQIVLVDHFTYATDHLRPVIFIPGILGSELEATQSGSATFTTSTGQTQTETYKAGDIIWPNLTKAVLDPAYLDLLRFTDDGQPMVNGIAPNGNLVTLPGGYTNTERLFTNNGYTEGSSFFVFTYDWRYGAERQVGVWHEGTQLRSGSLDELIQHAMELSGTDSVDIVAHSMGTQVARAYLTGGIHRSAVAHAVLLGAPNEGTPLGSWSAIQGGCFPSNLLCLLSPTQEQYIMRTLPGALELTASPDYCTIYDGHDAQHPDPFVNTLITSPVSGCSELQDLERNAQAPAAGLQAANAFHADDLSWLNSVPSGTAVSLFAGTGQCTLGQIQESSSFDLATLSTVPTFDYKEVDGDGTVVRQSASLSDGQFAPGASIYYRPTSHMGLANDDGVLHDVLAVLHGQHPSTGSTQQRWGCTTVSVHSPMELQVTDSNGRVLGGPSADALSYQIPDASYDRFGDMKVATLEDAGSYTITLFGTADGEGTVRLRTITQDGVSQEIIFRHVPTTPSSRGTLSFDTATGTATDLVVDGNGDGTHVVTIAPTTLTGAAANDQAPPSLTVDAPAAGQAVVGAFNLHWTATDAESGVADSLAVIDAASSRQVVNTPGVLSLPPGQHTVDVYAEDQAGNAAHQQLTLQADAYQWLPPLQADGSFSGTAGQTIPVKFRVTTPGGQFVADASVCVDLVDDQGNVVVPALQLSQTPSQGVVIQGEQYHANLSTTGVAPGQYQARVRFNSPQLLGEFTIPISLRSRQAGQRSG